jgi:hypothetical protein
MPSIYRSGRANSGVSAAVYSTPVRSKSLSNSSAPSGILGQLKVRPESETHMLQDGPNRWLYGGADLDRCRDRCTDSLLITIVKSNGVVCKGHPREHTSTLSAQKFVSFRGDWNGTDWKDNAFRRLLGISGCSRTSKNKSHVFPSMGRRMPVFRHFDGLASS